MDPHGPSASTDAPGARGDGGDSGTAADRTSHVLGDLGFRAWRDGDSLRGSATIREELHVPGTRTLRMSVLATWVDTLSGLLAVDVMQPRVPVTLQLDVNLVRPPSELAAVDARAWMVKAGGEVVVAAVELRDHDEAIGSAAALFMVARDPSLRLPANGDDLLAEVGRTRAALEVPLAERAGCERTGAGRASMPVTPEHTNAAGTLNGGLIALLVEEAALSAGPPGTLCGMALRYLRPVSVGPAVATATAHGDLAEVVVSDRGRDEVMAVMATTRAFTAHAR